MKQWSLRNKLLLFSILILVLAQGSMTWLTMSSMEHESQEVLERVTETSRKSGENYLLASSSAVAKDVSSYMNRAFDVPLTLKAVAEKAIEDADKRLSRDEIQMLTRQVLDANKLVSSSYLIFEPNVYDGNDAQMIGAGDHTTSAGSLETYWVRESETQLTHYPIEDPNYKYDQSVNDLGDREFEWYLCSRDSKKNCIVEPYLYEISEGNSVLMTSLTAALVRNGQFLGIAGTDIDLPVLQKLMQDMSKTLFDGQAQLHLITSKNRLVASSAYGEKLSRPLAEADSEFDRVISGLSGHGVFKFKDQLAASQDIYIKGPDMHWRLVVTVPEKVVFADVVQLQAELKQDAKVALGKMITLGLVALGIASFAIVLFVGTITRPLAMMCKRVNSLSTSDGDLTQTLEIDNHKELIDISQGMNKFIAKLRDMILELQTQSLQVQKQANLLSEATDITTETIARQTAETDSVATAMEEMSSTSAEVARLASENAEGTHKSEDILRATSESFSHSVEQVQKIAAAMTESSELITRVSARSDDINQIVKTIADIAEQTNLLALNAAIEAARAGEQGRGFAVVADEVRNLAANTQNSTEEINELVKRLQANVKNAVDQISSNQGRTEQTTESITKSVENLSALENQVGIIANNTIQVASAAEQQSQVNSEISQSVTGIGETAKQLQEQAHTIEGVRTELTKVVGLLDEQLSKLKV